MIIYILLLLILDRITKLSVVNITNIEVIKNFFYITNAKNTGIAFNFLTNNNVLITILSLIIIISIIYYVINNKPKNNLLIIGYSLLISGAIGNFIDRLFYGYVIDFINIYIFGYDYPIFNLADSFIVIGIIILILGGRNDDN